MGAELTIHFIRNYTAEPIGDAVHEAAREIGLALKTHFGAYDNLGAEIATLASCQEPPSIVLVTIDLDYLCGGIFSPQWRLGHCRCCFQYFPLGHSAGPRAHVLP